MHFSIKALVFGALGVTAALGGLSPGEWIFLTVVALVAGLAGSGRVALRGLTMPRADPAAPGRVIVASDANEIYVSENDFIGALRRELDRGVLALADRTHDAMLAGGVLRLVENDGFSAAFDLRSLAVELRANLAPSPLPKDWKGAAPPVAGWGRLLEQP